jgi:hypothetical protein
MSEVSDPARSEGSSQVNVAYTKKLYIVGKDRCMKLNPRPQTGLSLLDMVCESQHRDDVQWFTLSIFNPIYQGHLSLIANH